MGFNNTLQFETVIQVSPLAGSNLTTIALAVERLNAMRSPGGSPNANPLLHGGCYPMRKGGGIEKNLISHFKEKEKKHDE